MTAVNHRRPGRIWWTPCVLGASLFAHACIIDVAPPAHELGVVSLALTARGSLGNTYRLEGARFEVQGPDDLTLSGDGATERVVAELTAGLYQVSLQPGWHLVRSEDGQPARAMVRDDSLADIAVQALSTTNVRFVFDVVGGETVGLGNLEVAIEVNELRDQDADGVPDESDTCLNVADPSQEDTDRDSVGDACDSCPAVANLDQDPAVCAGDDGDGDGVRDGVDNCLGAPNAPQTDKDRDLVGDACDNCPQIANSLQDDRDDDGRGDACSCGAEEVCGDRVDNDCNGQIDEVCLPGFGPLPEVCDGADNDFDGVVDDGCGAVCRAAPEVCDGLDNDCDGKVDDGCPQ